MFYFGVVKHIYMDCKKFCCCLKNYIITKRFLYALNQLLFTIIPFYKFYFLQMTNVINYIFKVRTSLVKLVGTLVQTILCNIYMYITICNEICWKQRVRILFAIFPADELSIEYLCILKSIKMCTFPLLSNVTRHLVLTILHLCS